MHIRERTPDDAAAVAALHRATVTTVNARDYTQEQVERWIGSAGAPEENREAPQEEFRFVAEENGELLGFGNVDPTKGEVTAVYVSPDAQSKGAGSALLRRLEDVLREHGCERAVVSSTLTAKTFYEKHGYHPVRRYLYKDYLDCWDMEKDLRPTS